MQLFNPRRPADADTVAAQRGDLDAVAAVCAALGRLAPLCVLEFGDQFVIPHAVSLMGSACHFAIVYAMGMLRVRQLHPLCDHEFHPVNRLP
ncbi:hypothetical protein MF672_038075 [Actinomadura sp. ATCC 31491]|uniref:Uncharacterized protein n=1 Tax=Actinomadura luzonensis TaxID=2805427 RepID=A0ABT0G4N8_9ACTN|nr:hypothetical protein [Actinomadura luzonensis]MCK2219561.1 hypothetical protein [Actinomadura luzonensis]